MKLVTELKSHPVQFSTVYQFLRYLRELYCILYEYNIKQGINLELYLVAKAWNLTQEIAELFRLREQARAYPQHAPYLPERPSPHRLPAPRQSDGETIHH